GTRYARVAHVLRRANGDPRAGLDAVELETKVLHTHSWQSFICNETLRRFLEPLVELARRIEREYTCGKQLLWRDLTNAVRRRVHAVEVPLVDARMPPPDD